jgi:hypothetical protein
MMRLFNVFLWFAFVLTGCESSMSKKELLDYTFNPDNGLYHNEERNGVLIEVVYRPTQ